MAPLIIAHRGDSSRFPENTLVAFRAALEVGVDLVELDVQLSRDAKVVVLHDETLDRTTTGTGSVRNKTLEEIQTFSAHYASRFKEKFLGERVPSLAEALKALRGRARVLVEIKKESVDTEGTIERETVEVIERAGMEKDAAIVSFVPTALKRCLEFGPKIRRGHLFQSAAVDAVLRAAQAAECAFIMPEKRMLSPSLCEKAEGEGLEVGTWVVDDPEELRALAPLGLFGVCSNCPGLLLDTIWQSE
jgi:glycerophosphoryl diester phosphodiesterase